MISLKNYFIKPNYDILIETNVDQLFNIFEKELNQIDDNKKFDKIFNDFLKDNNIDLYIIKTKDKNLKQIRAESGHDNKTGKKYILIEEPLIYIERTILEKQTTRSILHELIHVLNNEKIPNFIIKNKNSKQRFNTRNTLNPYVYNFNEINIKDMILYLDYVTHIREKANFAFTIALSCYFDMNNKTPEEIFKDNFEKIDQYESGQIDLITFNNYILNQKFDTIELFTMQYAMFHVGRKNYINQIYSILRLSIKYWKRLNKLLGDLNVD